MSVSPIWPAGSAVNAEGEITFHGRTAASLLDEFGSPLYVIDTDDVRARATKFVHSAATAFNNTVTHVSFAGKALLSKEICRIVTESGMLIDTCTMGEMRIALAAGVPGRRLVLHGNNKSDAEIELAIEQGFNKIVIDEPDEPERVAAIARKLGKRARVMLRVTVGVHAGGHEYISTAHEDQKFGVPLLAAGADAAVLDVLNDLKDVTPAATNARISATHSPESVAAGEPEKVLRVSADKGSDILEVTLQHIYSDQTYDLGEDPGLIKDGVEDHLPEQIERIGKGAKLVRREYPTAIGPVDIMAVNAEGEHVAVEIKRHGGIDGVEQLTRYCELLNRDPLLAPVHGIFAAQTITPQAQVLAKDRGFTCLILDYDDMKGTEDDSLRLF